MTEASIWIDDYIKYFALFPAILIFGDWIYGRIILHNLRMQYDKQTREHDEYKKRCAEIAKELDRAQQTIAKQGITFLAKGAI